MKKYVENQLKKYGEQIQYHRERIQDMQNNEDKYSVEDMKMEVAKAKEASQAYDEFVEKWIEGEGKDIHFKIPFEGSGNYVKK